MNEVLKIEVQAQVQQAQQALKQLQTSLKGTEQAAGGVTKQMPKLGQGTNQANVALVNFGRVVQDAPFGLIGIANNIDPLLSSFQQLKTQTGSTSAAFKALVSSLAGPAGIAIAVSTVTSALIAFGPQLKSLVSSTSDFSEAFKSASEEISATAVEVFVLVDAVKSGTLTTEQLNAAQKQLVQENPKFRQAFKDGKVDIKLLNDALDDTVEKLLTTIKVSAASKILEKEFAKIAETILEGGKNLSAFQRLFVRGPAAGAVATSVAKENLDAANVSLNSFDERIQEVLNKLGVFSSDFIKSTDKVKQNTKQLGKTIQELGLQLKDIPETAPNLIDISQDDINKLKELQLSLEALANIRDRLRTSGQGEGELANLGGFQDNTQNIADLQFLANTQKKQNEELLSTRDIVQAIGNDFVSVFSTVSVDGENAFQRLGKAIEETTKRILIQFAVTKALTFLLNTIAPGSGSFSGLGSAGGSGGVLRGNDLQLLIGRGG